MLRSAFSLLLVLLIRRQEGLVLSLSSSHLGTYTAPRGAYIHIPFCRRRCFYCDFPIQVVGDGAKSDRFIDYTNLLLTEIRYTAASFPPESTFPLETIYFGGGTPSLLPIPNLKSILTTMKDKFRIKEDCEVTIEIDPGTFDKIKMEEWLALGVNRFSLGVQSFNDLILKKCGRAHTSEDVYRALEVIHSFPNEINFSIDLISGLPYLTLDIWRETLQAAVLSGASHVSVYDLQVEDKTAFGRWYGKQLGEFPLPFEDEAVEMYSLASTFFQEAGFEHYEVSNYAKRGKRSRHNQLYWNCESTYGFGMSAASFTQKNRFSRPKTMLEYENWVHERLVKDGYEAATIERDQSSPPPTNEETRIDEIQEMIMLSLRTSDGLNLKGMSNKYGPVIAEKIVKAVTPFMSQGLVLSLGNGAIIRLSDPAGYLVSNDIISSIFVEL